MAGEGGSKGAQLMAGDEGAERGTADGAERLFPQRRTSQES